MVAAQYFHGALSISERRQRDAFYAQDGDDDSNSSSGCSAPPSPLRQEPPQQPQQLHDVKRNDNVGAPLPPLPHRRPHFDAKLNALVAHYKRLPYLLPDLEYFLRIGAMALLDSLLGALMTPLKMLFFFRRCDLRDGLTMTVVALIVCWFQLMSESWEYNYSFLYHYIRTTSTIKIFLLFNILAASDALLTSLCSDSMDVLYALAKDRRLARLLAKRLAAQEKRQRTSRRALPQEEEDGSNGDPNSQNDRVNSSSSGSEEERAETGELEPSSSEVEGPNDDGHEIHRRKGNIFQIAKVTKPKGALSSPSSLGKGGAASTKQDNTRCGGGKGDFVARRRNAPKEVIPPLAPNRHEDEVPPLCPPPASSPSSLLPKILQFDPLLMMDPPQPPILSHHQQSSHPHNTKDHNNKKAGFLRSSSPLAAPPDVSTPTHPLFSTGAEPPSGTFVLGAFAVVVVASILHTLILLLHVVTLNVALNSDGNSLIALLISNNFSEIKTVVFKRMQPEVIFTHCLGDVRERVQLMLFSLVMLAHNVQFSEGDVALGVHIPALLFMFAAELLVDFVKHYFVTTFNAFSLSQYRGFAQVIQFDIAAEHCLWRLGRLPVATDASLSDAFPPKRLRPFVAPADVFLPQPARRTRFCSVPYLALLLWTAWPHVQNLLHSGRPFLLLLIVVALALLKGVLHAFLVGTAQRFVVRSLLAPLTAAGRNPFSALPLSSATVRMRGEAGGGESGSGGGGGLLSGVIGPRPYRHGAAGGGGREAAAVILTSPQSTPLRRVRSEASCLAASLPIRTAVEGGLPLSALPPCSSKSSRPFHWFGKGSVEDGSGGNSGSSYDSIHVGLERLGDDAEGEGPRWQLHVSGSLLRFLPVCCFDYQTSTIKSH